MLVTGFGDDLAGLAYLIGGHHSIARVAVAEALHEAAVGWDDTDPGPVTDCCLLGVVRWTLELHEDLQPSDDDDFVSTGAWALRRLPVDQRVVLALSVHPGLDETGTARLLASSPRVVRRKLRLGRIALARLLGGIEPTDRLALDAALRDIAAGHRTVCAAERAPVTVPIVRRASSRAGIVILPGRRRRATQVTAVVVAALAVSAAAAMAGLLAPSSDDVDLVLAPGSGTPVLERSVAQPTSTGSQAGRTPVATARPVPGRSAGVVATGPRTATRSAVPGSASTRAAAPPTSAAATRPTTSPPSTASRAALPQGLIVGRSSGLCFDVAADPAGYRPVRLRSCVAGAGQQVRRTEAGTLTLAGMCVDAAGFGTVAGTGVVVSDCHGLSNQQWRIGADGTIVGVGSGLCIAPVGGKAEVGAYLVLAPCDGSSATIWDWT